MNATIKHLTTLGLTLLAMVGCHNGDIVPDVEKELDHLIIEEIANVGTWHPKWNAIYKDDQYLRITNPTKQTLYLDGMALAQSGLSPSKLVTLREGSDYRATHFGAALLIRFPGKAGEKNYPVAPGKSVTIAQQAVDHTAPLAEDDDAEFWLWSPASIDLSKADFEWASQEQIVSSNDFPENPNVPNMETVYPVARKGDKPYPLIPQDGVLALISIPENVTNDMLLTESQYRWNTAWTTTNKEGGVIDDGGGHAHNGNYDSVVFVKIPNAWVVDAVQICPQLEYKWSVIAETVEKGSCSVFTASSDRLRNLKAFAGKALFRKHDGKKFVDTNNSDHDFEVRPASLLKTAK